MIVKCSNCDSAFTVSDDKVEGKKFAFSCPNCSYNNIIDNREESISAPEQFSEQKEAAFTMAEDDSFDNASDFDTDDSSPFDTDFSPLEEDIPVNTEENSQMHRSVAETIPDRSTIESTPVDLLDEIDESTTFDEEITVNLDDLELELDDFESETPEIDTTGGDFDLSSLDDIEIDEELTPDLDSSADSDTGSKTLPASEADPEDELDTTIDLAAENEELSFELDSFDNEAVSADNSTEVETEDEELSIDFDSLDADLDDEIPETAGELTEDEELSIDLDSLDADLDDEIPATAGELTEDDELSIDLDSLDAELDSIDAAPETAKTTSHEAALEDESISIDLNSLDADLDDEKETETSFSADESISIDLDSLDTELETNSLEQAIDTDDESISIDLDTLDAELDIKADDEPIIDEDESISIDLDRLDADLETEDAEEERLDEDESISIDLDSLDAELEIETSEDASLEDDSISIDIENLDADLDDDIEDVSSESAFDVDVDLDDIIEDDSDFTITSGDEKARELHGDVDDSITVDLDSLDMDLDELDDSFAAESEALSDDELMEDLELDLESGFAPDEDEAGEITYHEIDFEDEDSDDELRLTAQEVHLDMDEDELPSDESDFSLPAPDILTSLDDDDLPEIDLENFGKDSAGLDQVSPSIEHDIFDTIDADEEDEDDSSVLGGGYIHFTIDYSLKFSRIKALLRLLGLYYITFIPHILVNMLYGAVNAVISYVNNLVIMFSGKANMDFIHFQEKTLRYQLATAASLSDIVEDKPLYGGTPSIDCDLQLKVHPPLLRSRLLAGFRVSGVGILLLALPHIIIIAILSCAVIPFIFFGLLTVLFTAKWPTFIYDFMVRYFRYCMTLSAYLSGLVDSYPSFRFD